MKMSLWLPVVLIGVFLDQISKFYFRSNYLLGESQNLGFDWLNFIHAENPGVAFSLPIGMWIVLPLTVGVCGYLLWEIFTKSLSFRRSLAYSLVLAGAIGNFVDRVLYGVVTDFISVGNFPIFNVADSLITVGVLLWILDEIFGD